MKWSIFIFFLGYINTIDNKINMHIGRGLWYGSYRTPRVLLWSIGVIILILVIGIGFLGYVLPYGWFFWPISLCCCK
jgi:hypothetical protein